MLCPKRRSFGAKRSPGKAAKTEGQAFRFFAPRRLVRRLCFYDLLADADHLGIGKLLANDLRYRHRKPIGVVHILPILLKRNACSSK
jgi:hypothetical protein